MCRRSALAPALTVAFVLGNNAAAWSQEPPQRTGEPRALLRLTADSGVVGHYKFTVQERRRLVFDLPEDDPRAALLRSASEPKQTEAVIAATVVSMPREREERRYIAYWLGYRLSGDEVQSLSPLQWDSIFQKVGRRAVLRFSPRGQPRGVQVGSDAVRPVGQALAAILSGLAMGLPADSVTRGSVWEGDVAVQVTAPDGSRGAVAIRVTYRLREFWDEPGGLKARVEFDGEPQSTDVEKATASGRYFGESIFAVREGRYEQLLALANLELSWSDSTGLPPSRAVIEWQAQLNRQ